MKKEGGNVIHVESDAIAKSDHTLVFCDQRLLGRLKKQWPDIETRKGVAVIKEDMLDEWVQAVNSIMKEREIPLPTRDGATG